VNGVDERGPDLGGAPPAGEPGVVELRARVVLLEEWVEALNAEARLARETIEAVRAELPLPSIVLPKLGS
jgi:hypothetical protein